MADRDPAVERIRLRNIRPGDNDRKKFDPVALEELADSLRAHGLAQPITVRPVAPRAGDIPTPEGVVYEIVAGERRFRAAALAGWESIPALVRPMGDEQAAAIMLLENVHRTDINPLEEGRAYHKRMHQFGWSVEKVSEHANVTVDRVKRRLALLELCEDAQRLLTGGSLPIGHAELLAGLSEYRQTLALKLFDGDRQPSLRLFRAAVSELLAEQSQSAMFDIANFWSEQAQAEANVPRTKRPTGLEVNAKMPGLRVRTGGLGRILSTYIMDLNAAGQTNEALAVGRVLDELIQANYAAYRQGDEVPPPAEKPATPTPIGKGTKRRVKPGTEKEAAG